MILASKSVLYHSREDADLSSVGVSASKAVKVTQPNGDIHIVFSQSLLWNVRPEQQAINLRAKEVGLYKALLFSGGIVGLMTRRSWSIEGVSAEEV